MLFLFDDCTQREDLLQAALLDELDEFECNIFLRFNPKMALDVVHIVLAEVHKFETLKAEPGEGTLHGGTQLIFRVRKHLPDHPECHFTAAFALPHVKVAEFQLAKVHETED